MKFECDRNKARANLQKHRMRFTDAGRAIKHNLSLTNPSPQSDSLREERFVTVARNPGGRAMVVIWTPRNGNMRIISVRHARKKEQEAFDAHLKKFQ
ncbi:BrnT family toxin [Paracoccus mangrovi]|uniref:BrnT family toxin n=1 Tax=Paracoccus mangrovi TaxID=1715645 RepID=A0ABV7R9L2_9RHOB